MDEKLESQLLSRLHDWVGRHPFPDRPAIQYGPADSTEGLTPRQIVGEIEAGSEDGRFLLNMIQNAMETTSPEIVLKSFDFPTAAQAQAR